MDASKISYLSNNFCIKLDGSIDINSLNQFSVDELTIEQSAYMHEFYHYLINLTSFEGLRDFMFLFVDKVISVVNMLSYENLNAFPIEANHYMSCRYLKWYLKDMKRIHSIDKTNFSLAEEVMNSPRKKFSIDCFKRSKQMMSFRNNGRTIRGYRYYYKVCTNDLNFTNNFSLSIGAIDEFLSSSIDEYCFQYNLVNNIKLISSRPFYPYQFYDEILSEFDLQDKIDTTDKILIAYSALNSINPVCQFITILKRIKNNVEKYRNSPENFILNILNDSYLEMLQKELSCIYSLYKESYDQGRIYYSAALYHIYYEGICAKRHIADDFYYFIRPFLVDNIESKEGRQKFIELYQKVQSSIRPPLILMDNTVYKQNSLRTGDVIEYEDSLNLIMIMSNIIESLQTNKIPVNTNQIRFLNHKIGNDEFSKLGLYKSDSWQIALNQFGLLGIYASKRDEGC